MAIAICDLVLPPNWIIAKTFYFKLLFNLALCRVCYLARARAMARVVLAQIEFKRASSRRFLPMLR